jgi:PAS domain S-box-containing protein
VAYRRDLHTDRFDYVSPAVERITGFSTDEMCAMSTADMMARVHPDDLDSVSRTFETGPEGVQCVIEYRFKRKNGEYRWLSNSVNTLLDSAGKPRYHIGVVRDITERRTMEQALAASRSQLQDVIDNSTAVIYAFDLEKRFIMANTALAKLLQSTPEQMIGKRRGEFMPQEDAEWHEANDRRVIEAGKAIEFEEHSQITGRSITWFTTKFPLRDKQGRIYAVAGVSVDISERKQMERALRDLNATLESKVAARTAELEKERKRLFDVLESIPAMVCLLTPDYHVAFANRSFREKFGESNGRHCHEYCFGLTEPCRFCQSYQVLKTGQPHRWECATLDGQTIIDAHDYPFADVDGSPLILEMDIDITERKRAEAALEEMNDILSQRARQLQRLTLELTRAEEQERRRIAVILHEDLQQQIVGAKFRLSMVKGRVTNDRLRADIDEIGTILKEAIDQSRSLSGDLSPAVVNLKDLAEVLRWLVNRMQAQQGLSVSLDILGDVTLDSEVLATFLFRAAQEMLFNVVKHTQVRRAAIRVRRMGRHVCLSVSDQGPGFDPKELKATPGVGLFSIRERTELLGGRMKVKSVKGEGSTFRIMIPDGSQGKNGEKMIKGMALVPAAAGTIPSPNGALRVLLVDDHKVVRAGLAAMLKGVPGIELVGEAPDGREAIEAAVALQPDVVIMDVSMPMMKGDEATKHIKAYLPTTRVIGLSMYEEADNKERMLQAGADGYILKTASADDLIAAIRASGPVSP